TGTVFRKRRRPRSGAGASVSISWLMGNPPPHTLTQTRPAGRAAARGLWPACLCHTGSMTPPTVAEPQARDLDELVEGRCRDPFALLGPHAGRAGRSIIRTFQPAAKAVEIRLVGAPALQPDGTRSVPLVPMARRVAEGLYEAEVPASPGGEAPDYRLQ